MLKSSLAEFLSQHEIFAEVSGDGIEDIGVELRSERRGRIPSGSGVALAKKRHGFEEWCQLAKRLFVGRLVGRLRSYLILIIKSPEFHPIVRQIASTRSRLFAMMVIKERVGLCKTIQERIFVPPRWEVTQ
jgi:hypothetical protein